MNYLGVDLASKFSAGVVVNEKAKVLFEFDSWGRSQIEFADLSTQIALDYNVAAALYEDLPYGLSSQVQTKPATRLQGFVIKSFYHNDILEKLYFVNPSTWQRDFDGVFKGGPAGARAMAAKLGFEKREPIEMYKEAIPPLGKEHAKERSKVRAQLKKASTDYDDGFLIAVWGMMKQRNSELDSTKGVNKYEG